MSAAVLITQPSSSTHDPWGCVPASIGFMFHSIVILSCPHLVKLLLHKKSSLSSKPKVIRGQKGLERLKLCPAEDDPTSVVSNQLHPCGDAQRHRKEEERNLRRVALHFWSGDISFVPCLTDPALIPAQGWERVGTQQRFFHPRWERLSVS